MEEKINQWLANGGELFVVQEGEGGIKITDYAQLSQLKVPAKSGKLAEAIILEKDGDSRKSTNMENDLDSVLREIDKLMQEF